MLWIFSGRLILPKTLVSLARLYYETAFRIRLYKGSCGNIDVCNFWTTKSETAETIIRICTVISGSKLQCKRTH